MRELYVEHPYLADRRMQKKLLLFKALKYQKAVI